MMSLPHPGNALLTKRIAAGFSELSGHIIDGCVGDVDGVMIKITKPSYNGSQFYCRKGFFALNVQAVVDSTRTINYLAIGSTGSTHDSTAWKATKMFRAMEAGKLPVEYYICGDDAYSGCGEQMLCPYAGPNQPFAEDVFNFYQSRTRIAVECAFGELVGRWGILWRPLRHELPMATAIIQCCARLHNWCIAHRADMRRFVRAAYAQKGDQDMGGGDPRPIFGTDPGGRPGNVVASSRRDELRDDLVAAGMVRPQRSTYGR